MDIAPPPEVPKRRYKLDETLEPHPWRKRRDHNGQLIPALQSRRGVKDTETGDWHTKPRPRHQSQYADARAANGLPPLTTQKVRSVLKKAGLHFSALHTTRVRGWHSTTSGVTVWQTETGTIHVGYVFNHWAKAHPYQTMLAPALKALQDAGLNPTQHEDGRIEL